MNGPPTGRGIRIAVVDSGVHASHPHVGRVAGGVGIDAHGVECPDYVDRLGHGTAVAAAIHEKAPDADLLAVKVFDRSLSTSVTALVSAIGWCVRAGVHLVNLSLGTPRASHEQALREAVAGAASHGVVIVSARKDDQPESALWFPGSLAGVVGVEVDWTIDRDRCRIVDGEQGATVFASGFPRPIPGVAPQQNLHGVSFAVANVTGLLASAIPPGASRLSLDGLLSALRDRARADAP